MKDSQDEKGREDDVDATNISWKERIPAWGKTKYSKKAKCSKHAQTADLRGAKCRDQKLHARNENDHKIKYIPMRPKIAPWCQSDELYMCILNRSFKRIQDECKP